jgi:hypothetical protein
VDVGSHVLRQDVYPVFTLMAAETEQIRMGPLVTNPATRDPTVTASVLATLDDLSGGRMVALGLKGAEIVFNPSATMESLSKYLWELDQPAHAVANGYWIAAINRVGVETPLSPAKFYGSSYFCDPRGQIVAQASDSQDELVADLDLEKIREVRNTWQFLRDRRPETYDELTELLP